MNFCKIVRETWKHLLIVEVQMQSGSHLRFYLRVCLYFFTRIFVGYSGNTDSKSYLEYILKRIRPRRLKRIYLNLAIARDLSQAMKPEINNIIEMLYLRPPHKKETENAIFRFTGHFDAQAETRRLVEANNYLPYLGIRPLDVEMDVTNACNLRCVMCYFCDPHIHNRPRKDISLEQFQSIAEEIFPFTRSLSLSFSTEALMHRRFCDLIDIAAASKVPKLFMNTNGTLISERISEHLVRTGFSVVSISLDAATKETYERIRIGARFEQVMSNIETLNRIKKDQGSFLPRLVFSFVLMRSNIHELPAFIRLVHRLKGEQIHLMHMVPYKRLDMDGESLFLEKERNNRMLSEARSTARECGIQLCDPGDFPLESAPPPPGGKSVVSKDNAAINRFDLNLTHEDEARNCCPFPWHFIGITPYGEIQPCGWWYSGEFMGNIYEQSFEKIWKGSRFMELRNNLLNGRLSQDCRTCPSAGMGSVREKDSFALQDPFQKRI